MAIFNIVKTSVNCTGWFEQLNGQELARERQVGDPWSKRLVLYNISNYYFKNVESISVENNYEAKRAVNVLVKKIVTI